MGIKAKKKKQQQQKKRKNNKASDTRKTKNDAKQRVTAPNRGTPQKSPLFWLDDVMLTAEEVERRKHTSEIDSKEDSISFVTFNVLADRLALKNHHFGCTGKSLDWNQRSGLVVQVLKKLDADVISLQEVDHWKFFRTKLGKLGYHGIFRRRSRKADGEAIFWKKSKFRFVGYQVVDYNENVEGLRSWIRYIRNNLAILAILEPISSTIAAQPPSEPQSSSTGSPSQTSSTHTDQPQQPVFPFHQNGRFTKLELTPNILRLLRKRVLNEESSDEDEAETDDEAEINSEEQASDAEDAEEDNNDEDSEEAVLSDDAEGDEPKTDEEQEEDEPDEEAEEEEEVLEDENEEVTDDEEDDDQEEEQFLEAYAQLLVQFLERWRQTGSDSGSPSARPVIVTNAHLFFHPSYQNVKFYQTRRLIHELASLKALFPFGAVLCGDFNSLPDSPVYQLLASGKARGPPQIAGHNPSRWPEEMRKFSHPLQLRSAYSHFQDSLRLFEKAVRPSQPSKEVESSNNKKTYEIEASGEPELTTHTAKFDGTIDYIWFEREHFEATRILRLPSLQTLEDYGALPYRGVFPSDHLPLWTELRRCKASTGSVADLDIQGLSLN